MKYFLFFVLLFLSFLLHAQETFRAEYKIIQTLTVGGKNKMETHKFVNEYRGYLFKKGNKCYSYKTPVHFEEEVQQGSSIFMAIVSHDSIQDFVYTDLDSLKKKIHLNNIRNENRITVICVDNLNTAKDNWTIMDESDTINGFSCRKAILPDPMKQGENLVEAWVTNDLPNTNGMDYIGLLNVPGVIVKAKINTMRYELELLSYKLDAPLPDSVFYRSEVTKPCVSVNKMPTRKE